ncbi:hypothetical protein ABIE41_002004 [Bosea sp. OAE506]|uniref:hypothetical protein n=1 Tax=Bosea sp. OAE506 TaxID=2663870 RepID=UPI00339126C3
MDLIIDRPKKAKAEREESALTLAVTRPGDLWHLGAHRVLCGDAQALASLVAVLGNDMAQVVFTDPPSNVRIRGNVSKSKLHDHRDFAMAAGKMTETEFTVFLKALVRSAKRFGDSGAIIFALTCSPILGQRELESSGVRAHAGGGAGEPFISDIGGLLPMALCGRTSL